jgi:hypothetical protein
MSRASLLSLILSLTLGLGVGLYVGWVVAPVEYVDTDPASLSQTYKDDYNLMIAASYSATGDLAAARTRLATLGFDDPGPAVAAAAQRFIIAQKPEADLRRVVGLAAAFNTTTPEMLRYLPTPTGQTPGVP